ncbi:hypothetical protein [Amaricoccus solimangrovi]|uniref:Uncharacterized protein n=1 Tax=Amaricoccus solimangrovi TaxID=2589815 RepID=A0A501WQU1_9RHOB|nr:hypothetical protein [Amaricoccus solimangrovi]TPE52143.1 hypothetical protein FJM51_06875 [Amaricoccus solimangrovi]
MPAKSGRASLAALTALALGLPLAAGPARAADQSDPDWPCVQRKVPSLSMGQMWAGPPAEGDWQEDPEIARLAGVMAARRTTLDEVKALAGDYAAKLDPDARPGRMALLFQGVLDRINSERADVMSGISRYAHHQIELSDGVKAEEAALAALKADPKADPDKVEEAQDKLNWNIRVYRERAQSLTYVCETPVLLEQRAFAIARILAEIA